MYLFATNIKENKYKYTNINNLNKKVQFQIGNICLI